MLREPQHERKIINDIKPLRSSWASSKDSQMVFLTPC